MTSKLLTLPSHLLSRVYTHMCHLVSKPRTPPTPLKTFKPEFEIDNAVRTVERNQGTMPALSTSEDVKNEKENSYGRTSEENEKTPISANALQGIFSMCKFNNLHCTPFGFRLNCFKINSVEDEGFVPAKDGTILGIHSKLTLIIWHHFPRFDPTQPTHCRR